MGPLEALMRRGIALQQRPGDQVDEQGEGDHVLVGGPPMACKDLVQEMVGRDEIEQVVDGIGQRQALTDFQLEGLHGIPSLEKSSSRSRNLSMPSG